MFTQNELNMLQDALDMADKSNTRQLNSRTNPQFQEIHYKIRTELNELKTKIKAIKPQK